VPRSDSYRLYSEEIGQAFLVEVAHPPMPVPAGQPLPVVYVMDGNHSFAMTAQIARMLQFGPFPLPQTLVVGVGYHFERPDDRWKVGQLRMRDLTPCNDLQVEARFREAPAPWTLPPEIDLGGADPFLEFLEGAVKPFVETRYPVDPDDQTLVGMSAGGLFALHALFSRPGAFQRCVAISPALYWGERRLFQAEARLAMSATDLPIRLFLGVGGLEEAHDPESKMVSSVYEMESRLRSRGYPSLSMDFHVFPDETHMSVYPAAVSRGLVSVFGGHGDIHNWAKTLKA
jgi:predicted alpha/beta superfamily hydrolase